MKDLIACLLDEEAREDLGEALLQQCLPQQADLESAIQDLSLSVRRAKAERAKMPILYAMLRAWHGNEITEEEAQEFVADYCDDLAQGILADENPESEFSAFLEFFMEGAISLSKEQHALLHRAYYEARFKDLWRKASCNPSC